MEKLYASKTFLKIAGGRMHGILHNAPPLNTLLVTRFGVIQQVYEDFFLLRATRDNDHNVNEADFRKVDKQTRREKKIVACRGSRCRTLKRRCHFYNFTYVTFYFLFYSLMFYF